MMATAQTTMPKSCHCDHRLTFRRLPLGAFGKQDQDYDDMFNSAGYTLARPHFGLENRVHLTFFIAGARGAGILGVMFMPEFTPSVEILSRLYALHISVLPTLLFGFLGIHLFLIRFLDIHTHPGEEKNGRTFLNHLRKMFAHGFLILSSCRTLLSRVAGPFGIPRRGRGGDHQAPFLLFVDLRPGEFVRNEGASFRAAVPLSVAFSTADPRPEGVHVAARTVKESCRSALAFFFFCWRSLAIYAWLAPAQQHIM